MEHPQGTLEVRRGEAGRVCSGQGGEGAAWRLRRGEREERGQRTRPASKFSLVRSPGVRGCTELRWLPGPAPPLRSALQKQPPPALRARLRRPPRAVRMPLPQLAPPPLARAVPEPAELLLAASDSAEGAGRGVRARARKEGRDGGGDRARRGGEASAAPRGPAGRGAVRGWLRGPPARTGGAPRRQPQVSP